MTATCHALALNADAIPSELIERAQWVCFRIVERNGKLTKEPINPRTGRLASVSEPNTWATFTAATTRALNDRLPGVGFVLTTDDPYLFVDLDDCRDVATGSIEPDAWEMIRSFDSYAEVSVSGTGVHVFCRATMPGERHARSWTWQSGRVGRIELYDSARFAVVTGAHLAGTPAVIR